MPMWRDILMALTIATIATSPVLADDYRCREDRHVVAQCFDVRGRIMVYANGRINLWPVGTQRLLGVQYPGDLPDVGGSYVDIPNDLQTLLDRRFVVFGDFSVCPFTSREPGKKQYVCVDRADNLVSISNEEWLARRTK